MIKKIAVKHFVFTLAVCAGLMWAVSPPALAEEIGAVPADSLLAAAEKTAAEQTVALEEATMGAAIDPVAEFKAKILTLVNEAREKEGLNALSLTDQLSAIADVRAEEAATRFSHTRPDGTKCFSVFSQYDVSYRFAGENLAYGYQTPEEAFAAWMASPTHKANILSARYTQIGIGYFMKSNGKIYCSELFCTPKLTFKGLGMR